MPSITDVAKLAGVSIATVSRYLSDPEAIRDKNRSKVEAAIAETGYAPNTLAQNFRRGRTGIIMVVLPEVGDPFFSEVMHGIAEVAAEQHYSILVKETETNTLSLDEYSHIVLSRQADGIILLASICPLPPPRARPSGARKAPIVLGFENVGADFAGVPGVRIDNMAAGREATEHLIQLGHNRIGFITGSASSLLTADRERGYQAAMEDVGIPVAEGWIVEGNLSLEDSRRATRDLLQHPQPPTAIFCANDEMAMGCLHEIRASGLTVPDDISVVGFDDIRYAAVTEPPLTTIAQPARKIGERATVAGEDMGSDVEIIPHRLVVRGSTAPR
jgi:LacI family repressor for deo operon, udp, cdd, tsx, nupC, and nupG